MTALCNHATTSVRNSNRSQNLVVVVVMMMIKAMMYQQRTTTVVAFRARMVGSSFGRHRLQRSIQVQQPKAAATRLWSSKDVVDDSFVDPAGRRIRSRGGGGGGGNGWDDNNDSNENDNDGWGSSSSSSSSRKAPAKTRTSSSSSSWDDFDPWQETKGGGRGGDDDSGWGGDRPQRQRNDDVGWDGNSGGSRPPRRQPRPRDDNGWVGGSSSGRPERQRAPQRRRGDDSSYTPRGSNTRNNRFDNDNNNRRPRRFGDSNNDFGERGGPARNGARNKNKFDSKDNKDSANGVRSINMNALEGAGFVHLYGLSSILNALSTDRRDLSINVEKTDSEGGGMVVDDPRFQNDNKSDDSFDPDFDDVDVDDDDEEGFGQGARIPAANNNENDNAVKPQAQFRSYLFVQERKQHPSSRGDTGSGRKGNKATAAQQVLDLANARGVPVAHVDKGILNALSGNRPHQGYVLRCGKMYFEGMSRIPLPDSDSSSSMPSLWLVLDEVVDPQNLGALLRSAYFLGGRGGTATGENNIGKIGVLVCSKNSAPPSPVVSASSAGALELLDVYSTTNLPRTLNQAAEDGFRIIGASSSIPTTGNNDDDGEQGGPQLYDLQDLPPPGGDDKRPVILVLGSEGYGLRTLVANACTEFVRVPSGDSNTNNDDEDENEESRSNVGVDSLNVSVTGGILLWHLLHGASR